MLQRMSMLQAPSSVIAVTSPVRWEAVGKVRMMLHPYLAFPASVFVVLAN